MRWCVSSLLFFLTLLIGCGGQPPETAAGGGQVRIVASIFPLADIAREVGGEDVEVTMLLPPGQSPHGYEPQPRQAEQLARAHLLLIVGGGLDLWAERSAQASGNRRLRTLAMAKIVGHHGSQATHDHHSGDHEHTAHHGHAHSHAHDDPHLWLDPVLMRQYVRALAKTLAELDASRAADFARRGQAYEEKLQALDEEYRATLATVKRREFVSFHSAFAHLAARYGLKQAAVFDPDVAEFGPKRLEEVATFMKQHGIRTVFAEPQFPVEQLQSLARQAGARVARLDPLGNPAVSGYNSYLNLMRSNLQLLAESLQE